MGLFQKLFQLLNINQILKRNIRFSQSLFKVLLSFVLTFLLFTVNTASALEPQQKVIVKKVVEAFKQNDRMLISNMVSYPFFRLAPLAPINNQKEFLERYDELFDAYLLSIITNSNINTDWDNIGWRGVILNNGIVALDPEGKIVEIRHNSKRELALIAQLNKSIARGRSAQHRNSSAYAQTVVELTTERFHIRVDNVNNGLLRYTSWSINKPTSQKPDIVLSNGRIISSGRNQRFVFDNGNYSYQLNLSNSGATALPVGSLEVFKAGKEVINERATRIIRR